MRRSFIIAWALLLAGFACLGQASAFWQSRDSNYNRSISSGVTPATATYEIGDQASCASAVCTSALTLPTPAASNNVLVAGFSARDAVTVSGIPTYNLANMTQVSGAASGGAEACDIWYITGVTGTTASIVVTWSSAPLRSFVQTYLVTTTTPSGVTGAGNNSTLVSVSQSITVPTNGIGVAFGSYQSPVTPGFTNATLDNTVTSTNGETAGRVTGTGSVNVSVTGGQNGSNLGVCLGAWGP